jgi:hypothetical protein
MPYAFAFFAIRASKVARGIPELLCREDHYGVVVVG